MQNYIVVYFSSAIQTQLYLFPVGSFDVENSEKFSV
jgi:hypothetical protein